MNDEKMAETLVFPEENNECLPNFEVFTENEILETSNDVDDSEISLLIEENRNALKYNRKKTKTDLQSVKETRAIEEIPAEELNNLLCHLFVKVRKRNPSFLRSCLQQMHNCCRSEISTAISSVSCILTRPTGSPKYGATRKNIPRYYTLNRLIRFIKNWTRYIGFLAF